MLIGTDKALSMATHTLLHGVTSSAIKNRYCTFIHMCLIINLNGACRIKHKLSFYCIKCTEMLAMNPCN